MRFNHPTISIPAKDIDSREACNAVVEDGHVKIWWDRYMKEDRLDVSRRTADMIVPEQMVIIEPVTH